MRTTGGHPDSLTSIKVIDLMTTTVLATEKLKKTRNLFSPRMSHSHADSRPNNDIISKSTDSKGLFRHLSEDELVFVSKLIKYLTFHFLF